MKIIKTKWQGIFIEAPTEKHLSFLKKILRKVQKEKGILIKSDYLNKIRLARTKKNIAGLFYPASRMIKLDSFKSYAKSETEGTTLLIHEYIHAIDSHYDYLISRLFFKEYTKALDLIRKISKNKNLRIINHRIPGYQTKKLNFLSYAPASSRDLAKGEYNEILFDHGYAYDYCLTNPEEFAAVTMEIFLESPEMLNKELQGICQIVKKTFLKK